MKKKIVIISQTIFPAQSPRSFRATELAKEFSRKGHDVVLYAALGTYDYKIFERSNNIKIKSIGRLRFCKLNSDGCFELNYLTRLLIKLFHKVLEFPDIELMFKIPSIVKEEPNTDLLITVAIPFPLHWGAALSKTLYSNNFPKTWIADCGDPYMGNQFKKPFFYFKFFEKWFCKKVNFITIPIEGARLAYYPEFASKIKVIPQGFDFTNLPVERVVLNSIPTFAYAGTFYKGIRDPGLFLKVLNELDLDFKFIIFSSNKKFLESYAYLFGNRIEVRPFIQREELLEILASMDFLINFENGTEIHSPSKLIDYALTKRPILNINTKSFKRETIIEFLQGNYTHQLRFQNLEQFDIKNVTERFLQLLQN